MSGESYPEPGIHSDLLRDPVRLRGEQPVDKTDVVNQKDAESHAGQAGNRGQVSIDLEEFLSGINQRY